MKDEHVLNMILVGSANARITAMKKLLHKPDRNIISIPWGENPGDEVHLSLIIIDAFKVSDHVDVLHSLRSTHPQTPMILVVPDFKKFSLPDGLEAVDVSPMIPDVLTYKVDSLLKIREQEATLRLKERKVDRTQERLEREMHYQKETERILRENEQTLRRIFHSIEATSEAILITESSEIVYYANPAFEKLTGYEVSEVFGLEVDEFFDFEQSSVELHEMKRIAQSSGSWQGDVTLKRKDNQLYQAYLDVNSVKNLKGEFEGFIFIQRDISTLKSLMMKLENLARNDSLTGLSNRRFFLEQLHEELVRIKRYDHPMSLLLIDLDKFKRVNDTYGHAMGDQVLIRFSAVIEKLIRTTDFAGRYGGEEFVIALPETGMEGGIAFADRLRMVFSQEVFESESGVRFHATCSIGVVEVGEGDQDLVEQRFHEADEALYRAKKLGRNRVEAVPKAVHN